MKFRNKTTEAAALALVCVLVDVACGAAFRLFDGHWPSLGFWLSGAFVYVAVVVPTIRRGGSKLGTAVESD
jgi:hypothetical protein